MNVYYADRVCAACHFDRIKDVYEPVRFFGGFPVIVIKASISRCCLRCGFTWHERPLNEPEPEPSA